jgi:RNA polymerase sigma factor (sigma-70 family)
MKRHVTLCLINSSPQVMSPEQFTGMVNSVKNKLFRFAYTITGEREEAEDVVQDVLLKTWDRRHLLGEIQNFEAWCMRLVKNRSLERIRYNNTRRSSDLSTQLEVMSPLPNPETLSDSASKREILDTLMGKLSDKQRQILHLREVEGYAYQEIADLLGIELSTLKVELHRARKKMQTMILNAFEYEY